MGVFRTVGTVTATSGTPTPVVTGTVIAAVSFSIKGNIATIVLGAGDLPTSGYCGPNGYPEQNATTGSVFDIQGRYPAPNGNQITLWGFTTATYFNGKTITVLDCNPAANSFRFYFTHADVTSTNDAGNTAAIPFQSYRKVRIEIGQGDTTNLVYVGDLNVSSTRYLTALSLATNPYIEIESQNIRADRIFITGATGATVQVSTMY